MKIISINIAFLSFRLWVVKLCLLCIGTGAHKNHSITEKFDLTP